jgi:hypothetical protein
MHYQGPLCNRHDAPDEESLCEPARLLGLVWEDKRYPEARHDHHCMKGRDGMHPEYFQGPASYALIK